MNYENLIHEQAEIDFVYSTMDALQLGNADGHQALAMIPPAAIFTPLCRNWFIALDRLVQRGICPEIELIRGELQAMGVVKNDTDYFPYLKLFSDGRYLPGPMPTGQRLLELYQRRQAVKLFGTAAEKAADLMQDHGEVIFGTAKDALDIMAGAEADMTPAGESILDRMEKGERFAVDPDAEKLAWFGMELLDQEIQATSGNLVIVAARPGCGKTALALQTLASTAQAKTVPDLDDYGTLLGTREVPGVSSLFVSLELPKVEAEARLASWFTLRKSGKFWAGKYSNADVRTIREHVAALNRVLIWAAPSRTPWSRIESKIRGAVLKFGVKVVAIDYFGLIGRPDPARGSSPSYEAAKLSGQIRALAQSLGICIVLLCQINREGAEGEPGMEDLRDTGQLEQDAQTILALYKAKPKGGAIEPPPWEAVAPAATAEGPQETTWAKVLKNRNGRAGHKYQLHFDGSINRFSIAEART